MWTIDVEGEFGRVVRDEQILVAVFPRILVSDWRLLVEKANELLLMAERLETKQKDLFDYGRN